MFAQRATLLQALRDDDRFDAVVIGGGVNGIGVYRELSLQGLRVLLVERNDFASGCSAAPSRMIHGGLRYLENGEFDLVRESLVERDALLKNAPHMVRPLPTVIPITSIFSGAFNSLASFFGGEGRPSRRGALPIKAGLWLYDRLSKPTRTMPPHRFLGAAGTRARWPALTEAARFSAIYHDAWISYPERLCIEMIRDVAREAPQSVALNYAELRRTDEGYELSDLRRGDTFAVRPRIVIHATGAWLDESVGALAAAPVERMVAGTKGSHLVLDNSTLYAALDGHMVYFEKDDGRVCILFPYLGRVLAGSTDIRIEAPVRTRCEDDERDYILDSLRLIFPAISVTPDQVVFSYSGIRPLPQSSVSFTGRIPRSHFLRRIDGVVPQICMIGGKWTTFRAFAEQAADMVLAELGAVRRVNTMEVPIGGGRGFVEENVRAAMPGLAPERATHLMDAYGADAPEILSASRRDRLDTLVPGGLYSRGEILRILREEHVETLSDIVLRRTALAIRGEISSALIEALAEMFAAERGLSRAAVDAEKEALIAELEEWHGVSRAMLDERNGKGDRRCA